MFSFLHKSPFLNTIPGFSARGDQFLIMSFHLFQLIDITGKDQDESMIALHDCNGDVNRAINVLLEGSPDTVSIGLALELSFEVWTNSHAINVSLS